MDDYNRVVQALHDFLLRRSGYMERKAEEIMNDALAYLKANPPAKNGCCDNCRMGDDDE